MTDTTRVRVICDQCGTLICRVMDGDSGMYYRSPIGGGMDTLDPRTLFCPVHGWPDLTDEALTAKLARARETGRVGVFRARASRRS